MEHNPKPFIDLEKLIGKLILEKLIYLICSKLLIMPSFKPLFASLTNHGLLRVLVEVSLVVLLTPLALPSQTLGTGVEP